jgi:hypothetical protein
MIYYFILSGSFGCWTGGNAKGLTSGAIGSQSRYLRSKSYLSCGSERKRRSPWENTPDFSSALGLGPTTSIFPSFPSSTSYSHSFRRTTDCPGYSSQLNQVATNCSCTLVSTLRISHITDPLLPGRLPNPRRSGSGVGSRANLAAPA